MFVKICGITTVEDAALAAEAGANAIGLVFAPSRRQVDVEVAAAIVASLPEGVLAVGVFRDHLAIEVVEIAAAVGLGAVQLHGDETPYTSRAIHAEIPVLIRAFSASDPNLAELDRHGADVVLLDAPVPGGGETFDWSLVGDLVRTHRVLLAGGLRPDNVAAAIATVQPWGVDVSSGVEAEPGRKDPAAVRAFVDAVRSASVLLTDQPSFDPLFVPETA